MAFFGTTVNFIIEKLKSKHFVCLSFIWFFEGTWENILHIFRAQTIFIEFRPYFTTLAPGRFFFAIFTYDSYLPLIFCLRSLSSNDVSTSKILGNSEKSALTLEKVR